MPVIAQDTIRYSALVKREDGAEWGQCKKMVTVNGPAATLPIGTVLGQVGDSEVYKVVEAGAADGSQTAVAVIVGDAMGHPTPTAIAANTDAKFLVLYRGICAVSDAYLTFGASVNTPELVKAAHKQLAEVGIDVLHAI